MKLFNIKIRLGGNVNDEVLRTNATNAEIKILRSIHGEDAVVDIQPLNVDAQTVYQETDSEGNLVNKVRPRTEADERFRLEMFYNEQIVAKLFGAAVARITDEPSPSDGVLGAVIPLEPPMRTEVKPVEAPRQSEPKPVRAAKSFALEDMG